MLLYWMSKISQNLYKMKQEDIIRLVAGTMVLLGISLAYFVSVGWLLLPAFVAVNLIQSAFSKWCPLISLLDKFGVNK